MRKALPWIGLMLGLIAIDQLTKAVVLSYFPVYDDVVLRGNFGISCVLHEDEREIAIFGAVVAAWVLMLFWSMRMPMLALCLATAGGVSNQAEMLLRGGVVDFLAFDIFGHVLVANLADVFVVAAFVVLFSYIHKLRARDFIWGSRFWPPQETSSR